MELNALKNNSNCFAAIYFTYETPRQRFLICLKLRSSKFSNNIAHTGPHCVDCGIFSIFPIFPNTVHLNELPKVFFRERHRKYVETKNKLFTQMCMSFPTFENAGEVLLLSGTRSGQAPLIKLSPVSTSVRWSVVILASKVLICAYLLKRLPLAIVFSSQVACQERTKWMPVLWKVLILTVFCPNLVSVCSRLSVLQHCTFVVG